MGLRASLGSSGRAGEADRSCCREPFRPGVFELARAQIEARFPSMTVTVSGSDRLRREAPVGLERDRSG